MLTGKALKKIGFYVNTQNTSIQITNALWKIQGKKRHFYCSSLVNIKALRHPSHTNKGGNKKIFEVPRPFSVEEKNSAIPLIITCTEKKYLLARRPSPYICDYVPPKWDWPRTTCMKKLPPQENRYKELFRSNKKHSWDVKEIEKSREKNEN